MDMQMSSNRRANDRRQHIISQSSSLNQSQTSSPLSKKRRLQLPPPTTETNISQSLSSTPTQTPSSPASCRRCSSQSRLVSVEKRQRPPRHPDSPIPTSSSSIYDDNIPQFCSRHDIIDDYKNEKYPKELLARIEKKNSYTKIDDNEQRDEKEDGHRSVTSNDTLSIDTGDEKDMKNISSKTDEESSNVKVSEVIEQKKDSILDFFKRLPNTLMKRRIDEKDCNVNDKSVSCEVGVVSPISEDEILDEQQQRVVSNDTFRLLLSRSQEEEAFDGVSDSLHLKSESSESELQKKVLPDKFECLDIWP